MTGSQRDVDGLASLGPTVSVWAHPDDETYLAGGVYAALRDHGVRVVCVTATRGEAGGPGTDAASRSALGQVRTRELDEALAVLGVGEHHWLGHQDGECAQVDSEVAADQIAQVLDEVQPQTVLTFGPDGFTGHADHRAVSHWVDLAVRRSTATPTVLHAVATEAALCRRPRADLRLRRVRRGLATHLRTRGARDRPRPRGERAVSQGAGAAVPGLADGWAGGGRGHRPVHRLGRLGVLRACASARGRTAGTMVS